MMGLKTQELTGPIPLEILDRHGMKAVQEGAIIHSHSPKEALGLTLKREGAVLKNRDVVKCCLLRGIPAQHMASTMAHELAHVYLWLSGFPKLPPQVEEGLCELVSAEWLHHTCPKVDGKQDAVAAFLLHNMENNTDQVYGGGYRSAVAAKKKLR